MTYVSYEKDSFAYKLKYWPSVVNDVRASFFCNEGIFIKLKVYIKLHAVVSLIVKSQA